MMQITDLNKEQQITPLFRLGFRPFFLAGALFSVIAILLWIMLYRGALDIQPLGGGYWWGIYGTNRWGLVGQFRRIGQLEGTTS